MTYQTSLKIGDIITIGKSKTQLLVVRSERRVDHDRLRGDSYSVDEIDTIKLNEACWHNPKVTSYYFEGGSMSGTGTRLKDTDIKVAGTAKFKKIVEVRYDITSQKLYG